jgi:hypothetical protein
LDLATYVPAIRQFAPTQADQNVPSSPQISARFSTDINQALVDTDDSLNQYVILLEEVSGVRYPVSYLSYDQQTLTFVPQSPLRAGYRYMVTILGTIPSPAGRTMGRDRSWVFQVSTANLSPVVLVSPSDMVSVAQTPTFEWEPAAGTAPTGTSVLLYNVEVDVTPEFASVGAYGWSTQTSGTTATPSAPLASGTTFWWRVTAGYVPVTGDTAWGPVSDYNSFYLGTFVVPDRGSRVILPPQGFDLCHSSIANGSTNLQAWPPLVFDFTGQIDPTSVTSGSVFLIRRQVDDEPQTYPTPVNISCTVNGNTLTVVPTDQLFNNGRYTIYIEGLKSLAGDWSRDIKFYFTSWYFPLYVGVATVRSQFGRYLESYSDDFINFHIFRVSLDVNRYWIRAFNPGVLGGPPEQMVRGQMFTLTWAMERWTEIESCYRILKQVYLDRLTDAGRMQKLGDYAQQTESRLLDSLQTELKRLQQEANLWVAEFSRKRARVRTGRKSEFHSIWMDRYDMSRPPVRSRM